jgi:DegV family protein with EDD domain
MGQGQLTVLAAECAAKGLKFDASVALLESQVPKVRTFALLKDLRYAVRGGRLPQWVKTMADLMRVTPVICIKPSGSIGLGGCLLGRRNRIGKFAQFIASHVKDGESVEIGIGQAICPEDAEKLALQLKQKIPSIDRLKICGLGTGLGVHGGPGTLIVSFRPVQSANDFTVSID